MQFTINLFAEMGARPYGLPAGSGLAVASLPKDSTPPACRVLSFTVLPARKVLADNEGVPERVARVVLEATDGGGGVVAGVEVTVSSEALRLRRADRWHFALPESEEPLTGAASRWGAEVPLRELAGRAADGDGEGSDAEIAAQMFRVARCMRL